MNSLFEEIILFEDFTKLDIRIGTIVEVADFPKARIPAYQLLIDFGEIGKKKSSAQITELYEKLDLVKKQVIAVINFKPKQIANFTSECLILGVQNEKEVVLLRTLKKVHNGTKIS